MRGKSAYVRRAGVGVAATVLVAITGGVAVATTLAANAYTDADGKYHGCVGSVSGFLRVVVPGESCRESEVAIDWNQTGPQGPPGPQGEPGPQGPPGGGGLHAHVSEDGTLDAERSSAGITMSRVQYADPSPFYFPVYCFDLPAPADATVATPEVSPTTFQSPMGTFPALQLVALTATAKPSLAETWGCPAGTDAAVMTPRRPNTALYAIFS